MIIKGKLCFWITGTYKGKKRKKKKRNRRKGKKRASDSSSKSGKDADMYARTVTLRHVEGWRAL